MKLRILSLPLVSFKLLLLFLSIVLLYMTTASTSHANGRVLDYQIKDAGLYQIGFGSVPNPPRVGAIHVSVTITALKTENAIKDPEVLVQAFGPNVADGITAPIQAIRQSSLGSIYEANTDVDTVGPWTFMVTVSSGLGDSSASFVLDVQPSNPFLSIMSWVTVTVFVALVVLGIYPFITSRIARLKQK